MKAIAYYFGNAIFFLWFKSYYDLNKKLVSNNSVNDANGLKEHLVSVFMEENLMQNKLIYGRKFMEENLMQNQSIWLRNKSNFFLIKRIFFLFF